MFYKKVFLLFIMSAISLFANDLLKIKSFEAKFEQSIKSDTSNSIEYFGKIYIKEPAKILWKYEKPIIKNVYVIANIAIVDEPDLEQAIYTRLENNINVLKILRNAKKVSNNLYNTTLNNVEYKLHVKNNIIKQIDYVDELENKVSIKFSDIKVNDEIANDTFQFIAPDYYDIIKK